jgi:hypothetical protein
MAGAAGQARVGSLRRFADGRCPRLRSSRSSLIGLPGWTRGCARWSPLMFGIQVIGRRWHDEQLLAIAEAIAAVTGGFRPPPGV